MALMRAMRKIALIGGALAAGFAALAAPKDKFLFANAFDQVSMSSDGNFVAMTERLGSGGTGVRVAETGAFEVASFNVGDGKGGDGEITDLRWLDNRWLVLTSKGEDGDVWLHVIETGAKNPVRLAKEGSRSIAATIHGSTRFIALEQPNRERPDVCRFVEYDAAASENSPRVVYEAETQAMQGVFDRTGRLRLVKKTDPAGSGEAWFVLSDDGKEKKLAGIKPWMRVYGIYGDTSQALVAGQFEGSVSSIVVYDMAEDRVAQTLTEHAQYALDRYGEMLFDPATGRSVGLFLEGFAAETFWTDPELEKAQSELEGLLGGSINRILGWSDDRKRLLVERIFSMLPRQFCYVEPASKRVNVLVLGGGRILPEEVGPTKLAAVPNRDGVALPIIVTLPAERPEGRLPLLVWIRKGVWSGLDRLEWHPEANYFAAHGYAVLRVNYRGSEGLLGSLQADPIKADTVAATFRDIEDAVDGLVQAGVVDPGRVAIGGEAEGAWAAAYAAKLSPDRYQASLMFCGLYELAATRDEKTGGDASGGVNLGLTRPDSGLTLAELDAFSIADGLSGFSGDAFVCYGKWSPVEYRNQVVRFVKTLKKADVSVRQYSDDWWGPQLSGAKRVEAFRGAVVTLKSAFK